MGFVDNIIFGVLFCVYFWCNAIQLQLLNGEHGACNVLLPLCNLLRIVLMGCESSAPSPSSFWQASMTPAWLQCTHIHPVNRFSILWRLIQFPHIPELVGEDHFRTLYFGFSYLCSFICFSDGYPDDWQETDWMEIENISVFTKWTSKKP
jgi:hypothetical protein